MGQTPETNPTLALAKSLVTDTAAAERVRTIAELHEEQVDQERAQTYERMQKERTLDALHEARQGVKAMSLAQAMNMWRENALGEQIGRELDREIRADEPIEGDIVSSMGLSIGGASDGDAPDKEDTPMSGGGSKMSGLGAVLVRPKTSNSPELRNASLVGYAPEPDAPVRETYLEETAPGMQDRLRRGVMGGGIGGLAGGASAYGAQKAINALMPHIKGPRMQSLARGLGGSRGGLYGAGLGLLTGGLLSGLSNRSVNRGYDTASGEEVGMMDRHEAQEIFDHLQPGQQPGNFAVGGAEAFDGFDGGTPPSMAYGVDLDEAIAEDPLLAAGLLKGSAVRSFPDPFV